VTSELLESSFFQIIVVGRGIGGSAAAFRAAHHSSCPWGPASCARAAEGRHGISRRHSGIRADDAAGRVHDRSSGRLSTREEPGLLRPLCVSVPPACAFLVPRRLAGDTGRGRKSGSNTQIASCRSVRPRYQVDPLKRRAERLQGRGRRPPNATASPETSSGLTPPNTRARTSGRVRCAAYWRAEGDAAKGHPAPARSLVCSSWSWSFPAAATRTTRVSNALPMSGTTEPSGSSRRSRGSNVLVLSHLVPPDDPKVTDRMCLDAARTHFGGEVIVGRDLLEV